MPSKIDPKDLSTFPTLASVRVNGITMKYVDIPAEGTQRGTVVFVHGFPEFWAEWRYQLAYFSSKGYRCIAMNTRGYNGNEPHAGEKDVEVRDKNFGMGQMAQDIKELLDHLGIKKMFLVGHDWGSVVVQRFALLHPDYVEKLVTICIPYNPPADPFVPLDEAVKVVPIVSYQRYFCTDKAEKDINENIEEFIDIFFRYGDPKIGGVTIGDMCHAVSPTNGIIDWARSLALPKSTLLSESEAKEYADFYRSIGGINGPLQYYRSGAQSARDFKGKGPGINVKTLFVACEFDPFWKEPYVLGNQLVPGIEAKMIKGAGHWVAYEKPDELNKVIEEFIEA
ncbi:Alpha/Beta hydrolase protein [Hyaloraphidium curvatum]|nr:Alpha/Beta hydrolase protein [Hyaloraphidium curvatum]